MKKSIYTLVLALALSISSNVHAGEVSDIEMASSRRPNSGNPMSYANFYSHQLQMGIGPNQIVQLTDMGANNDRRYRMSANGGFIVPFSGNYLISYRVVVNSQISLALYENEDILSESAFTNTGIAPIEGNVIVSLTKNDVISIRSIEIAKSFNTVISVSSSVPTIPVAVTVQFLDRM